ncbi:MAG: leucyl/phenylalanyl-tRNA--protein transferase [Desulfobacterales bacterium]|jgi:leucyl/phenylalanyl-tRNA--protein transferase|nr:leucyl/phenylalanyl-tRNA--protein transferase [Desulfobacterales bacterium]
MPIFRLSEKISFPPPRFAEPEGLLAVGGDLSQKRLLLAYRMGIFPWYSQGDPILWWSPDPRMVLYPDEIILSSRLKRLMKQEVFEITFDRAFDRVIHGCAQARVKENQGTWILDSMIDAYCRLHESGYAHSVESWHEGKLAGGLYGVSMGGCFFGESMFTEHANASKIALAALCDFLKRESFDFIDCQVASGHLQRMGAREISREQFLKELEKSMRRATLKGKWI